MPRSCISPTPPRATRRPGAAPHNGKLKMAAALALLLSIAAYLCLTEPPPRVVPFVGIMSVLPRGAL